MIARRGFEWIERLNEWRRERWMAESVALEFVKT